MRSRMDTLLSFSGAVFLLFVVLALGPGCQQDNGTPVPFTMAPDEQDSVEPEELLTQMAAFMAGSLRAVCLDRLAAGAGKEDQTVE